MQIYTTDLNEMLKNSEYAKEKRKKKRLKVLKTGAAIVLSSFIFSGVLLSLNNINDEYYEEKQEALEIQRFEILSEKFNNMNLFEKEVVAYYIQKLEMIKSRQGQEYYDLYFSYVLTSYKDMIVEIQKSPKIFDEFMARPVSSSSKIHAEDLVSKNIEIREKVLLGNEKEVVDTYSIAPKVPQDSAFVQTIPAPKQEEKIYKGVGGYPPALEASSDEYPKDIYKDLDIQNIVHEEMEGIERTLVDDGSVNSEYNHPSFTDYTELMLTNEIMSNANER